MTGAMERALGHSCGRLMVALLFGLLGCLLGIIRNWIKGKDDDE